MPSNRPSTTWVALLCGPGSALVRLVSTLQHVPYRASSRISNVFVLVPDFTIPPTDPRFSVRDRARFLSDCPPFDMILDMYSELSARIPTIHALREFMIPMIPPMSPDNLHACVSYLFVCPGVTQIV